MTVDENKIDLIRKLLAKAEGTSNEEERDAYNAKATNLMLQYGIEDAMLTAANAERAKTEQIISKTIVLQDVPKSYSYEYAALVIRIARALGMQGFMLVTDRKEPCIVGFESDIKRSLPLLKSLVWQCTDELQRYAIRWVSKNHTMSGTDKYNAKRAFIVGFTSAVQKKMTPVVQEAMNKVPGAELVLVDRTKQIEAFMNSTFNLNMNRGRNYGHSGYDAGHAAGMRADVGQGKVGGTRRPISR